MWMKRLLALAGVGLIVLGTLAVVVTLSAPSLRLPVTHTYARGGTYLINAPVFQSDSQEASASTIATVGSGAIPSHSVNVTWAPIGPDRIPNATGPAHALASGKLQTIAIDPTNPNHLYVAGGVGPGNSGPSGEAGVWETTNGGETWSPVDHGLGNPMVDALWIDPANPKILLAGTWYGTTDSGIFRSVDGGANWTEVLGSVTSAFSVTPSGLYAATTAGVAFSTDVGASWTTVEPTNSPVRALAYGNGTIYAGLDNGGVLVNVSGISGWTVTTPTTGTTVWSIAVEPAVPSTAFVVEWRGYQTPDLYETTNAGASWNAVTNVPSVQYVAFNATYNATTLPTLYIDVDGQPNLYVSYNLGASFAPLPLNADIRLIDPVPGGPLYVGSDQGIFKSIDGGQRWIGLSANVTSALLTAFAIEGPTIVTAVQDFSPILSFDGGSTWTHLMQPSPAFGEDGTVAIAPGNPSDVYVDTTASFQYSIDGGRTFRAATGLPSNPFGFVGQNGLIAFDPNYSARMYLATNSNGVYESTDGGVDWSSRGWPYSQPSLVYVDPISNSTIFVGTMGGLFVTRDGGATWQTPSLGSVNGYPIALAVDPTNASIVLVGLSNGPPFSPGLLRSIDGGRTFAPVSLPVPAGLQSSFFLQPFVNGLLFIPNSPLALVATAGGLYGSTDLGTNWYTLRDGSVPWAVTGVAYDSGSLFASTYGEGILRAALPLSLVTFAESGLPPESSWSVALSNDSLSSMSSNASFRVPNGTYAFTVGPVPGYVANPSSGYVTVNGKNVTEAVTFSKPPATYTATFTETGLPSGTSWSVTLAGVPHTSATSTIAFSEPNGIYAYTIESVAGYTASPSSGSVTVNSAGVSTSIMFTAVPPTTYDVNFAETGLPAGTSWSVTLAGTTRSSITTKVLFNEPDGTYSYTVSPVTGYTASPSSGTITVNGESVTQPIAFSGVPRAPTISSFSTSSSTITLGSSVTFTVTAAGGAGALAYAYAGLPSGCSSANASTLTCTPTATGSFTVTVTVTDSAGRNATATASLIVNPQSGGSPSGNTILGLPALEAYAIFAAIAIVVGGTVAVLWSRRKRLMPPPPTPPRL